MSYILSALKKAEQERRGSDVPDVLTPQTVVEPGPGAAAGRRDSRMYFIGAAAAAVLLSVWLVNALRVERADDPGGGLFSPREAPSSAAVEEARDAAPGSPFEPVRPAAPAASPPPASAVRDDFSTGEDGGLSRDFPRAPTAAQAAPEWPSGGAIPDLAELPPALRKNMPPLELTGHLYSLGHPNARKVILNGAALKEGQYLDDNLMVSEITPDGVILDFQGRLFRIGADLMFR